MAVPFCSPTVTVAPSMGSSEVASFSTTFIPIGYSVRSLGLILPFAPTSTETSTLWPFASTVTVPFVGIGTLGSVTHPSLSVSMSWYEFPTLSTRVTVAPRFTRAVTSGFFVSLITFGSAWPAAATFRVTVLSVYLAAAAFVFS